MRAAFCLYVEGERKGDDDVGRISLDETGRERSLEEEKIVGPRDSFGIKLPPQSLKWELDL